MCVMNFLMDTIRQNQLESAYNFIIENFKKLNSKGNEYIPISYFIRRYDKDSGDIYEVVQILIEYKLVSKYEFERCPYCYTDNKIIENVDKIRCSKCKEIFYSDFITEKFKVLEKDLIYVQENE